MLLSMAWRELFFFIMGVFVAGVGVLYALTSHLSHKPREIHASELEYQTVSTQGKLPNIRTDDAEVDVTVVVPSYNEEKRLRNILDAAAPYLTEHYDKSWEILIVDDGSTDRTRETALDWASEVGVDEHLRYTRFVKNRGKGGAVTHGMKTARGRLILFADADGASDFTNLGDLVNAVESDGLGKPSVAVGSRAHLDNSNTVIQRTLIRNILQHGFHLLVYWFGIRAVKDSQCGFKLFTRPAARSIFPYMHTEGWIFDVEALLIATRKDIPVHEVAISWHEVTGSKMDLARDSIKMAIDLVVMRFAYVFGIYQDGSKTDAIEDAEAAKARKVE